MPFDERSMVGHNQEIGCLFEDVSGDGLMITERAFGGIYFAMRGGVAPILHAVCSPCLPDLPDGTWRMVCQMLCFEYNVERRMLTRILLQVHWLRFFRGIFATLFVLDDIATLEEDSLCPNAPFRGAPQ